MMIRITVAYEEIVTTWNVSKGAVAKLLKYLLTEDNDMWIYSVEY